MINKIINVLNSMDIDEKEFTHFICSHSDSLDQRCILNLDKIDQITKYFTSYRISKVSKFCDFVNNLPSKSRGLVINMMDDLHGYVLNEKNYKINKAQQSMFIDSSLAYTLVPIINEKAILDAINN